MWIYKIRQFKECLLMVIAQNFAQRLSGSRGSRVSCHLDEPMWRYATLPVWNQTAGSCFLITSVFFGKFFYTFLSEGSTDAVCKVLCKSVKSLGGVGFQNLTYITRFSTIQ